MSIYYIESKVLSPDGKRLALTFVADGKAVAVSAGGVPIERQQWILTGLDTSSIIPALDKALQVWQKQIDNVEYAATISVDKTLWNFTNTGDGWTISDPAGGSYWTTAAARENSAVLLESASKDEKQLWLIEKSPAKGEHGHHHHHEHNKHNEEC